jgi:hypothetical protein
MTFIKTSGRSYRQFLSSLISFYSTILQHPNKMGSRAASQPLKFAWRPQGDLNPYYRRERAIQANLKKGSLARGWANFLFFKTNFSFCIFCMFPYILLP